MIAERRKKPALTKASSLRGVGVLIALAAILAVTFAAVGSPSPAGATPADVIGGQVVWGVKESFRTYVAGPAGGVITTSGGATQASSNGVFTFPNAEGSYETGDIDVAADGSVQFEGHFSEGEPELDLTVSNVRIEVSDTTGFVVVDLESLPLGEEEPETFNNIQLVTFSLIGVTPSVVGDQVTYTNVPTTLTSAGAPAFAGFYTAGTAFDPITFSLTLESTPEPPADLGSLTWKISEYAWTSSSLAPSHAAGAPAVKDPDHGFVFPATAVEYDPETGATQVDFAGSATLGNVAQGGYRISFIDPRVVVDESGDGALQAIISYCVSAAACANPWITSEAHLTVVSFQAGDGAIVDTGDHVSAVYTAAPWIFSGPPWPDGVSEFDQEFTNFLASSLRAHFWATGATGSNLIKPPAPMQVEFDYEPVPAVGGVEIITTVVGGGIAMSIDNDQVVLPTPELNSTGTALETSGLLGTVRVVDTRTSDPGWNATAQITDFTGASTIDGNSLGWTPSVTSTSSGQSVTPGSPVAPGSGLSGAQLATALAGSGLGTAELDALLALRFPTNAPAGTYTATLTITAI